MIFFNSSGDECGGLIYDGNSKQAMFVFSIDQFLNDQIMQLRYVEDTQSKKKQYGLQLWNYPVEHTFSEKYPSVKN